MEYQAEVLIADSSAAFCAQLRLALERGGTFRVIGMARTTEEALELVRSYRPDLAVVDLSLPGADVLTALRIMRAMDLAPDMLVLTNIASGYVFRYLVSLGVSYFLCKPCSVETVLNHLEMICLRRFPERSAVKLVEPGEEYGVRAALILREMGTSPNLKGYQHLCRAIELAVIDPNVTTGITKTLYPLLAKESRTTPDRVERNIRTAIDAAWRSATTETRQRYFGAAAIAKPTNSRFIETLARYLQMHSRDCQQNG